MDQNSDCSVSNSLWGKEDACDEKSEQKHLYDMQPAGSGG